MKTVILLIGIFSVCLFGNSLDSTRATMSNEEKIVYYMDQHTLLMETLESLLPIFYKTHATEADLRSEVQVMLRMIVQTKGAELLKQSNYYLELVNDTDEN